MDPNLLSTFEYVLPNELIAREPAQKRSDSRLLVVDRKAGTLSHRKFSEFPDLIPAQSLIIANNSKVIRSRLLGQRLLDSSNLGGRVEFLLLAPLEADGPWCWEGAMHASARYVPGLRFVVTSGDGRRLVGEVIRGSAESPSGTVGVRFDQDPLAEGFGEIPLPHYLERSPTLADETRYQTVYAKDSGSGGSAAAPTAGLHFSEEVLNRIKCEGHHWQEVTLHVGLGTFRSVKSQNISEHVMHEESYWVSHTTSNAVTQAKRDHQKIVAVGTTSVRTLESAWRKESGGFLKEGAGKTSLFIRPGLFEFQVVDVMLTNFHLPGSTLLMLVSTFGGLELIREAYQEAIRQRYRFFSYGDAMLVI